MSEFSGKRFLSIDITE